MRLTIVRNLEVGSIFSYFDDGNLSLRVKEIALTEEGNWKLTVRVLDDSDFEDG